VSTKEESSKTCDYSNRTVLRDLFVKLETFIGTLFTKQKELKIKIYCESEEPVLSEDNCMAFWKDIKNGNKLYIVYRRGAQDQVKVELR